ncbi:UNVERIFIED_CONTAM: Cytochrome c oxidase subunit [Sesamum latifolium]|uniref:Cytochrome c oxidase subunit 3 n=1 Tax=Sesamum latifolium TaxID=2727402 RepID=A0AAW2SG44_9LAMI
MTWSFGRAFFSIRIVEWRALQEKDTIAPRRQRFSRFSIALFSGENSAGRERDQAEPLGESKSMAYFGFTRSFGNNRRRDRRYLAPKGIGVLDPWEIPFLNTLIPPSSGAAVTWAHHAILAGKEKRAVYALVATVLLALVFTGFQGMEYYQAPSTISDSIYGSTFFLATGFHGFHVIIGTLFLIICGIRQYLGHLTKEHHVGFEAAAWDRRDYGGSCSPRNDSKFDLGLFEIVSFNRNQRCFLVSRFFSEQIEEPNGSNSSLAATKDIGFAFRKERSKLKAIFKFFNKGLEPYTGWSRSRLVVPPQNLDPSCLASEGSSTP